MRGCGVFETVSRKVKEKEKMADGEKKKRRIGFDRLVAIITVPVALFLIYTAATAPKSNIPQTLGPQAMPIGVLILIMVCAVFIFINESPRKNTAEPEADDESAPKISAGFDKYKTVVLVVAGLLVYGFMLEPVGFIISTTLLVLYSARLFEKGKWVRNILSSLLFSLAVYYTFVNLLDVMLPSGIFGW